ncbi:hypothetical protein B5C34_14640 [Pacificimonas flava]|uniref:General secretion pathway protein L n=2 Tax=Pacificimonas TaxID=1960290 RepID=A0A219B093_9SPHN|nr:MULTISPECIES: type II secretion system protein GspL [Pacificimonas]MBZ6379799.1 hypothetical protein [Pacificimonas aurantium]OWV31747.1 hypothetical protein B5C34_14640 [Pacificimonas flava]
MTGRTLYMLAGEGAPVSWARIGADGKLDGRGTVRDDRPLPHEDGDFLVVSVPGDRITIRAAELPGTQAQARTVARLALGSELAGDPAALHIAAARAADLADRRLAAAVDRRLMDGWTARLEMMGIVPDRLVPAPLLLTPPDDGYLIAPAAEGGGLVDVRGADAAFSAPPALARTICGDAAIRELTAEQALLTRLQESEDPELDLLQGDYARRGESALPGLAKRASVYLFSAALLFLAAVLIDGVRHDRAADRLTGAIAERAAAAGVGLPAATDPLPALRLAAARSGAGGGFSLAMETLAAAVRGAPGISVSSLSWAGGRLGAEIRLSPGADSEALRPAVEAAGLRLVTGPVEAAENGSRSTIEIVP